MMNYREQTVTDPKVLNRLSTGSDQSRQLSSVLSQLAIRSNDREGTSAGFFSRITSSIFSSYESSVRCSFLASCKLRMEHEQSDLFVGIKSGGKCCLFRTDFSASPPTAVELKCVDLSESQEGYEVSSIFLGRSQGTLVCVSFGEGRISLLTVKGEKMSVTKNFQLPLVVPVTDLFLNERDGSVELYCVLDKKQVLVLPDITKPGEYSFLYTTSLREQIKISEFSSISESAIEFAWEHRFKGKQAADRVLPVQSSLLLVSRFNNFESLSDFRAMLLWEKVEELFRIRHTSVEVPLSVRAECVHRLREASSNKGESLAFLIDEEARKIEKNLGIERKSGEIISILFDAESEKLVMLKPNSAEVSEIVPLESQVEKFVFTFMSAPFVFAFINQRLSRESVLSFFPAASNEWINVFACSSIFESIGGFTSGVIADLASWGSEVYAAEAREKIKSAPAEVKQHIADTLKRLPSVCSGEKRVDMIACLLSKELSDPRQGNWTGRVDVLERFAKQYVLYAVHAGCEPREDLLLTVRKLSVMNRISHACMQWEVSVGQTLSRMEQIFLQNCHLELSYLSSVTEPDLHANFRAFHTARIMASSSKEEDRETALSLFRDVETEISLYSKKFKVFEIFSAGGLTPQQNYWLFVASCFANDYKREVPLLSLVASKSQAQLRDVLQKKIVEKAIANGDWNRVKADLGKISNQNFKQQAVRLICTEARIRNELFAVFDIVKENKDAIDTIISEVELEIKNSSRHSEQLYLQIYSLSVFAGEFSSALESLERWHQSVACPFISLEMEVKDSDFFEYDDIKSRLDQQIKAAVLSVALLAKLGKDNEFAKKKLVLAESLAAFYSFSADTADPVIDHATRRVSAKLLSRNLAALGLVNLAFNLAVSFKLEFFFSVIAPYLELLLKCEKDASYLPPCRWAAEEHEQRKEVLMAHVSPEMAFVRSDASGPIGGSQIVCMRRVLETVLKKINSKHVTMAAIEYLVTVRGEKLYAFLQDLAEVQAAWTDLLRIHMRMENWKECVRLVETHVKFWRPDPIEKNLTDKMLLEVPLLVQLQRALKTAALDEDLGQLDRSLDATLESLKLTLRQVSQRIMI